MNEQELKTLADKYKLDAAFVSQLFDKLTDKKMIEKALRMFNAGTLKYEVAIGDAPIDIAAIRHEVAGNFQEMRKRIADAMKHEKEIHEYYSGCKALTKTYNGKTKDKDGNKISVKFSETAFIKDGKLVAFGHFETDNGGIYMADNEVMPNFKWNPREALQRIRNIDRVFFKEIKKCATKEPLSLFIFDEKTIKKDK